MGIAIGVLLICAAVFIGGVLVGRATAPDRGPRKRDLRAARKALSDLDKIVAESSLELSMLGSDVATKASDVLRKYWRGDNA